MAWFRTSQSCALVLAITFAAGVVARAQNGASSPPPADAGAPPPATAYSGKGTLEQMKEDLFKPLEPYGPKAAIDRVMNPVNKSVPFQMPHVDEQTKEKQQREQEWFFSDFNDLNSPPTLDDMAGMPDYGPDGRDRKKLSPMERFYDELGRKPATGSNSVSEMLEMMWAAKEFSGTNGFSSMAPMMPGMNDLLKALLPEDEKDSSADKGDALSAAAPADNSALVRDQKRRAEQFKRMLNNDSAAPDSAGPAQTFTTFSDLLKFGSEESGPVAPGSASIVSPYSGGFSPTLGASVPVAPGFQAPASTSAAAAFNASVAPKTAAPPPQAPPRTISLDPFKDNMPKRAF